jgi:hypothetical protein
MEPIVRYWIEWASPLKKYGRSRLGALAVPEQGGPAVNKVSSPSLVIVSVLLAAFVASVVFYLALSPERNAHTGPSAPQSESTGSR